MTRRGVLAAAAAIVLLAGCAGAEVPDEAGPAPSGVDGELPAVSPSASPSPAADRDDGGGESAGVRDRVTVEVRDP